LIAIATPDLILADWRSGLSCRQIAAKHGFADHKPVARFLRATGLNLHSRQARRKVSVRVLGVRVTNLQAARRRKPPMSIPIRSEREGRTLGKQWTVAELPAAMLAVCGGRPSLERLPFPPFP
jgi:hypothetical protein